MSFNTDKLVEGDDFDYVTRTSLNQGILKSTGFVNEENINEKGTWSLGLLQMDFFYRKRRWYAGQFVRKIVPKINIPEKTVPFITAIFNKLKPILLPILVRNIDNTFRNLTIKLPITNNEIDFDFMESFVAELEAQRVAELEAYLKASGLDNYELSSEEQNAIINFDNIKWAKFNLECLFGKSTRGKRLKSADRIEGNLPFVTAGEGNEGISAYISNDVDIFEKNTTTIDMFGSAKYRNYKYGADDHIAVVHTENLPKNASIFITSAIHKSSHNGKFDYGNNFYATDADELNIMLPEKNGKPNYEIMESIVSAIHKLVVKDVVEYANKKIDAIYSIVKK